MLTIEAVAKVYYTCHLTDEEEQKVLDYIKNNEDYFACMSNEDKIIMAVSQLSQDCQINLYDNSVESDFVTDKIKWSEFEERDADEILDE